MTDRRPNFRPPRRPRGFTLLELLVAMGMVAILAVSLYASMRIAFKAKSGAEAAIEPGRTAELAMEFLRTDFENATPPTSGATFALSGTFEGASGKDDRGDDADDVVFYTTADSPQHVSGNGEIKRVELTVEVPDGSTDHVLVRRVTRNLLAQIQPDPDEEVLCRGVSGFAVRYFNGTSWLDNWDSTQEDNTLPAAVEVTLQLDRPPTGQDQHPPRFVRIFPLSCSTAAQDPNVNTEGEPE